MRHYDLNPLYQCNRCKSRFNEPSYIEEREVIDYGIGSTWVTLFEGDVCPECESTDYELVPYENEDDDTAESDETVGVGLQQEPPTADDRERVA